MPVYKIISYFSLSLFSLSLSLYIYIYILYSLQHFSLVHSLSLVLLSHFLSIFAPICPMNVDGCGTQSSVLTLYISSLSAVTRRPSCGTFSATKSFAPIWDTLWLLPALRSMTTPLRKRGEIGGQGQGEGKGKREGKGETVSSEFHDEGGFHTHTSFCQHLYNIYRCCYHGMAY